MSSSRTTREQDVADLERLILRVQTVVDDAVHPRNGTARDLLLRLRAALRLAESGRADHSATANWPIYLGAHRADQYPLVAAADAAV